MFRVMLNVELLVLGAQKKFSEFAAPEGDTTIGVTAPFGNNVSAWRGGDFLLTTAGGPR